MRILHVAESARGGVGTYLAEILPFQVEALGRDGIRALVPAQHAPHLAGVDRGVLATWDRRERSVLSLRILAAAVRAEVESFAPTIVHAHSSLAGMVVRMMYGRRSHLFRIVYCPHGWAFDRNSSWAKNRLLEFAERRMAGWTDVVVAISEHERRRALAIGIRPEKIALVLNGIADVLPARAVPWDDERLKVLFVGRLDRQKGFDTLLDAVEPLIDRISLRVVGQAVADGGPKRITGPQVKFRGWRSLAETASEIAAADVVVVPSRWEGFGLVALEAMRAGKPVVASSVGGLREIVVDGVTGRLVPPDSPARLMEVLMQPARADWQAMGVASRRRYLEHFTAARMNRELADLYARLSPPASAVSSALEPVRAVA